MLKTIKILSFLCLYTLIYSSECDPHVKVKQGELVGQLWRSRKGRIFIGFTGIPYAKPPVEGLRFKAPVELEPWDGILNATKLHPVCPQLTSYNNEDIVVGNENCLFLNVYTPQIPSNNSLNPLFSVIFYIHGGSFVSNSASPDWLGPEILLDKDIVLVTVNYRLGLLGFLSTGDNVIPGNSGLKDQNIALKWVKQNILQFSGNPNKITIVGNSAGSSSAQFHMMSPLSRDLITNAVLQSGSVFASFALSSKEESVNNTYKLGEFLNCSTNSINTLVECLQKVDVDELIKQQPKFMYWGMDSTISPFRPVVEIEAPGAFIFKHPKDILETDEVADIPVLIGLVAQEAAYQSAGITTNPEFVKQINENFESIVLRELNVSFNNKEFAEKLKEFYFNNQEITNMSKSQLTDMYTDGFILTELDYTIRAHLLHRKSPIYLYLYEYAGSFSFVSLYDNSGYDYGVCHTDELFHLFSRNKTFPNYVPTDSDNKVTDVMTTLWSNFVHFGNPTPIPTLNITKWNPVSTNDLEYYHIESSTEMYMKTKLLSNRTEFWRSALLYLVS